VEEPRIVNQYLLNNLLLGLPTMVVCLVVQALLISSAISYYRRRAATLSARTFRSTTSLLIGVMLLLVLGNLAQIGVWGLLGEFEQFGDAFYHSSVNFATLGYGDVVMSARHRLLGPLEAINGALMIGASTAILMVAYQDALQKSADAPRP
jgi:hypothetical protein